jgi:hypothetical protein
MVAGFIALLVLGFLRDVGFRLSEYHERKEALMNMAMTNVRIVGYGALSAFWAIGTSAMAVPLSA